MRKTEIPDEEKKGAGLKFHHRIVMLIEKKNIPPQLVINFDQTAQKYGPVRKQTMTAVHFRIRRQALDHGYIFSSLKFQPTLRI